MLRIIKKFQVFLIYRKQYLFFFTWLECYFIKIFQFFQRTQYTAFFISDIQLYNFFSCYFSYISYSTFDFQYVSGLHLRRRNNRLSVFKLCITQSIAKWEKRFDFFCIIPAITHQNIFFVFLSDTVSRITDFSIIVSWAVF